MVKINLLPEEQRRTALSPVEQFHRTPLMWMVAGMMVALPLVFWLPIGFRYSQLQAINAKMRFLEPKQQAVDELQRVLQTLRAQEVVFEGLLKGQDLWAKRLNILSDLTPEGVWYTELTLEAKGLVIHGSAIGDAGPGMLNVTRLVQALKADAEFMSAVKDIQIESIKRVQDGEVEVMQFTLSCALAEKSA